MSQPSHIAVIGTGIAGLAAAWLLQRRHRVTVFEAADRPGGHAHTLDITVDGHDHPVDTGFLVYNDRTYPHLAALFRHLGVASVASEMTFSVSLQTPDLEWAGSNVSTVFGQKRNLLRRRFWGMLADVARFNREGMAWLTGQPDSSRTLRDFLRDGRYGTAFSDWYLLPMAAAIWSCPTAQMLDMPLTTFVRFCHNHGLLQLVDRPQWRTVQGGSREYVRRLAAALTDLRLRCPVRALVRTGDRWLVHHPAGVDVVDQVVLACHSDQALELVGAHASQAQRDVLAAIRYQPNRGVLHTDARLLPRRRSLWSAWNYFAGRGEPGAQPVSVSYLINRLQPLPVTTPVIVTLNPAREPDPAGVLARLDYAHPVFDRAAIEAQQRLPTLQGHGGLWFAGAWCGHGFHEDGLKSAMAVADALGTPAPWRAGAAAAAPAGAAARMVDHA